MRFRRLALRNFKCFGDADVDLSPGVTVVHGINGSGKSSLLEATFFALYGATAIDRTLDEIVTIGEEEAEIDLWFAHGGEDYHLHRRIRATGERATTAECTLEGPNETITSVGDVEDRVRSMLRMDSEAFVNSAFVRQGEINKLIEASPADRKRMIDRLLQLGRLETYRERAREARLGVASSLDRREGSLASLTEQIDAKDEEALRARKADLDESIADLEARIEELEAGREEARETKTAAENTLETYEERKEELETVTERIEALRERVAEAESRREKLADSIAELRDTISSREETVAKRADELDLEAATEDSIDAALEAARDRKETITEAIMDLKETVQTAEHEAETASERATELRDRAAERREKAAELREECEDIETTIEELKDTIAETGERINEHRAAFDGEPVEFGAAEERIEGRRSALESIRAEATDLREEIATLETAIEEAEELKAAGKCPACGQPVDGSPHVDRLDDDRERLEELESELESVIEERESIEEEIEAAKALRERERTVDSLVSDVQSKGDRLAERRSALSDREERIEDLLETAAELEEKATDAEATAEAATERAAETRQEIGEQNASRADVVDRIDALESLRESVQSVAESKETLTDHEERRADLADRNTERKETLSELRERKRSLEEDVDETAVESAREKLENATAYLEQVSETLAEKRAERDEAQSKRGGVTNELEELRELEEKREKEAATVDSLKSLKQELTDLETMYGSLRTELRQRNVDRLEALLNESFGLVYRNDAYARIELDGAYELTIYQKDGSPLDPDQLSGGERALFNLSLRAAIYRLLVEGIEGTAPMPPLILDEPTVFLDAGHVSQLVSLVESMRDLGVEQILVVSHDEELIGAADDLLRVEKDPTTNRSTVESVSPQLPGRAD